MSDNSNVFWHDMKSNSAKASFFTNQIKTQLDTNKESNIIKLSDIFDENHTLIVGHIMIDPPSRKLLWDLNGIVVYNDPTSWISKKIQLGTQERGFYVIRKSYFETLPVRNLFRALVEFENVTEYVRGVVNNEDEPCEYPRADILSGAMTFVFGPPFPIADVLAGLESPGFVHYTSSVRNLKNGLYAHFGATVKVLATNTNCSLNNSKTSFVYVTFSPEKEQKEKIWLTNWIKFEFQYANIAAITCDDEIGEKIVLDPSEISVPVTLGVDIVPVQKTVRFPYARICQYLSSVGVGNEWVFLDETMWTEINKCLGPTSIDKKQIFEQLLLFANNAPKQKQRLSMIYVPHDSPLAAKLQKFGEYMVSFNKSFPEILNLESARQKVGESLGEYVASLLRDEDASFVKNSKNLFKLLSFRLTTLFGPPHEVPSDIRLIHSKTVPILGSSENFRAVFAHDGMNHTNFEKWDWVSLPVTKNCVWWSFLVKPDQRMYLTIGHEDYVDSCNKWYPAATLLDTSSELVIPHAMKCAGQKRIQY